MATVPAPAECPGAATSIDVTFNQHFHLIDTSSTFHATGTTTGTWIGYDAGGNEVGSGHYTSRFNENGPGFPKYTFTTMLKANGSTADGERINLRLSYHVTIGPDGDVRSEFSDARC